MTCNLYNYAQYHACNKIQYVSEFEERGNFMQNAIFFVTFQPTTIPVRALGFRIGLLAVWAFYFTDPMSEL